MGFSPSKSIPSVTKELNGKEHVVNSSIQKKGDFTVLVIQEVTPRLVLRSGNAVVGLENSGFARYTPPMVPPYPGRWKEWKNRNPINL
ncbi:VirB9 [Klebsiella pneumoniae]|uniref:VirB9 n=1 Tax=Klebsiella pneumoniae TaxID=573 RepID=A0A2X3HIZ0_KLEPN|nr:VirB9 [Klebsiella pneumoniae]